MGGRYVKAELQRTLRNRRFVIFSFIFPLILYIAFTSPDRHDKIGGVPFPLYYMIAMASFGALIAAVSIGPRISTERQQGWTRQMRLTPLPTWYYFVAKILAGYMIACLTLVVLYLAGLAYGVQLSGSHWLVMTGLFLVGLFPFTLIGVMIGHLLKPDTLGPVTGGVATVFLLIGGGFGNLGGSGFVHKLFELAPSYWLIRAGAVSLGGSPWTPEGWIVVVVWSLAFAMLARVVYRRDTARL
jgi:ABC-2 type transport system permease protein